MDISKRPKILVTGGTGFVGRLVVPLLREAADVYVMSRSGGTEVKGDLTKWNAGLNIEELRKEKFDIFLHMAGLYDLRATQLEVYLNNVQGTNMALRVSDLLQIPIFVNTSSVAAAVNSKLKIVKPYDLDFNRSFHDPYAESKALAERVIQNWRGQHKLKLNLRLGIIVGDSVKGEILRLDGPYYAAKALESLKTYLELLPVTLPLPGNPNVRIPLVPVDKIAWAISQMTLWGFSQVSQGQVTEPYESFHLVPKIGVDPLAFYQSNLKFRYIKTHGVKLLSSLPKVVAAKLADLIARFPEEQMKYILQMPRYDSDTTRKILGENWCPEFHEYERAYWSGYEKFVQNC